MKRLFKALLAVTMLFGGLFIQPTNIKAAETVTPYGAPVTLKVSKTSSTYNYSHNGTTLKYTITVEGTYTTNSGVITGYDLDAYVDYTVDHTDFHAKITNVTYTSTSSTLKAKVTVLFTIYGMELGSTTKTVTVVG